ncbi:MAG: FAD-binding oxidoreductase [Alphaproteobacteria bacterium]|nr:FAD-binding oxidoreductase [Alphaproteobacteria bacterium]
MARPLFDASQYDWSRPVDSYWESQRDTLPAVTQSALMRDETTEVAIIGGGYCGLSAAYHLARAGIEVCVLEAGPIGWGASGRNGGFCSIGASFLGASELTALFGEAETLSFYRVLVDAVRTVEQLALEESIDIRRQGDGVWTFAHKAKRLRELQSQAQILERIGVACEVVTKAGFEARAFRCDEQYGALFESAGFGLGPLAFCSGLARAAATRGATLHARSLVTSWRREGGTHLLVTASGTVRAKRVIVAGNGWLPEELCPALAGRVMPVLSNINVTRPLSEDELHRQGWKTEAPASNTRAHLAYLRLLPDKRLLFGGRGDTTGTPAGGTAMRALLERRMGKLFPALKDVEITHSWRGFIAATMRLTPAVGELPDDPSVSYAFGCHGNGVAFMTWAGRELAKRIAGTAGGLPAPLRGLPARFPLPSLRLWQLRAILARAWLEDALL